MRFRVGGDEFVLLSCDLSPARGLAAAPLGSLSASERCVAELVLEGRSNNEIAGLRSTSVRTVANQIAAVFRKLNVRSRRELHALARRP
ncbi:MAG TPA: helix-turn-helix transcriptional regulator [Polyangiaceae bacterium]|nr:helix-turn-helix transcriptional regulator [Polyangiaceae bacterium]